MAKRNNTNENEGVDSGEGASSIKISRINEPLTVFDFPCERQLLSEEMVIGKHSLDHLPSYIPFRAAGNGIVYIQRSLLVELYEKEANEKVTAGVFVVVPSFPNREEESFEDWKNNLQAYWKREIGSFLEALYAIGEKKRFVASPYWYVSVNWSSLKTICTISDIAHDVFIQANREVQYEWHLDSKIPRFIFGTESPVVTDSVPLMDLKMTDNYKLPVGSENTSVWLVDSKINYCHLLQNEAEKIYPSYYEYSNEDDFQDKKHEVSKQEDHKGDYKHGTLMCKILCAISSSRTSIHFVKVPELLNNEKHILQSLNYIAVKANKLRRKWNVILITIGSEKFRCVDQTSLLYVLHHSLHQAGFVFVCSAGNALFPKNIAQPLPKYPLSFFVDCPSCVVVGAHAVTPSKVACLTTIFGSVGCCTSDEQSGQSRFVHGVHAWTIGEKVVFPKTKYQQKDSVQHGTSIAAAVVAATATFILPKLLSPSQKCFYDKVILSKKLKELVASLSDKFVCPNHGTTRKLIFNSINIMDQLKLGKGNRYYQNR